MPVDELLQPTPSRSLAEIVRLHRYGVPDEVPTRRTASTGAGRLRPANRIADTSGRRRPAGGRAGPSGAAQWAMSMPLGSTPTSRRHHVLHGAAATPETAFMAAPLGPGPDVARRRNAGPQRSEQQCQVIAVGRPRPGVTRATSIANGLTTPMCTCATSYPP